VGGGVHRPLDCTLGPRTTKAPSVSKSARGSEERTGRTRALCAVLETLVRASLQGARLRRRPSAFGFQVEARARARQVDTSVDGGWGRGHPLLLLPTAADFLPGHPHESGC